jgi:ATPase subunit of ABC transporter with duplicated ATPase domains
MALHVHLQENWNFTMITINNLAMNYGAKLLFTDVNLILQEREVYGLIGANGAGKSTFLRVLMGEEEAAFGEVTIPKGDRVGWLKQDQFSYEDMNIIDVVIAGREPLWNAMKEKDILLAKEECDDETGFRLAELEQTIFDYDGYEAETDAAIILTGLGIKEASHYMPLKSLSGGFKLRVLLAQSLFNNPDILLLDEPTNHLDLGTIFWLENYLRYKFKGVLMLISHDISFLNNLCTRILDIDYGEVREYVGNYDKFVVQKKLLMDQKLSELAGVEKKIAHMQAFVDKFRAGTRARQAASRGKMIDKMELPDVKRSSRQTPFFLFKTKRPSGRMVLDVKGISKAFGEKQVLKNVSFTLNRGEKMLIIGPNGIGKSTFLKIILNKLAADAGTFEWGHETSVSYFSQDHHDLLNESQSVLAALSSFSPESDLPTVRAAMGQVLFKQDDADKNILKLSGGEGARLLLAKVMLEQSNVLVLDEPTNHLDIESKEALKEALGKYQGTLILVSHDRYFVSDMMTRIITFTEKGVIDFPGSYEEYLSKQGNDYLKRS